MKNDQKPQVRERLDKRLSSLKPIDRFRPPPRGWVRAIRDALSMTGVQFAKRLGIRPQSLETLEKSEASGTISLKTLARAAEALDCTLVYALVPNKTLEQAVAMRARKIALRDLGRVSHTMKLEAQETADNDLERRIDAYVRDEIRPSDLWKEP